MKTFRAMNQEWHIEATYGSLRRVRNETGVDLTKIIDPNDETHKRIVTDPFLMMEVVCSFIGPELAERNVTPEKFFESLDEEAGEKASIAVMEAIIDFFPPARRAVLSRAWERMTKAAEKVLNESVGPAMEAVDKTDFEALARSTFGTSETNSRESSDSTPTPTVSAGS